MDQSDIPIKTYLVQDYPIKLSPTSLIGSGGEGNVYQLTNDTAVKLYHDADRATQLEEKILALCKLNSELPSSAICPIDPVYENTNSTNIFSGFTMKLIQGAKTLDNFRWTRNNSVNDIVFDSYIANLLYDISDALHSIHRARIVIGDLKPENIIISDCSAYFIDFDSVNILEFEQPGPGTMNYLDPRLRMSNPRANGPFLFDIQSDWWALGVVAFELFLGALPWQGVHKEHKNFRDRAFAYSAFYFDSGVVKSPSLARPKQWLDGKERISAYFNLIFSDHDAPRPHLDYALLSHFERVESANRLHFDPAESHKIATSDVIGKDSIRELLVHATHVHHRLKDVNSELIRLLAS